MIPETSVDWKAFEYKYSDNPQRAFENLTYYLFCHEFNQKNGIFRYFNQPHIETNPITQGDKQIAFQAKYYNDSVSMSNKEAELKEAVEGAARSYPGITTLYFYIGKEFTTSSKKDQVKPQYQIHIEDRAKSLGIEIVWRGPSHIEAMLMQNSELTICRNVFFQVDSAVCQSCDYLEKHKKDIFGHIRTSVQYKDNIITLEHNVLDFESFLNSNDQILLVDGEAGSGKSALIKQKMDHLSTDDVIMAFRSTDLDVEDSLMFLDSYGSLSLDEILMVYEEADNRILYIDAAEKYFVLDYQQTFEDILGKFMEAGWKIVLTIRSAYKESLYNSLLNKARVQTFHVNPISDDDLLKLATSYGFKLPKDQKLIGLLCAPFYLGLYLALDHIEDEAMLELNREVFEHKIWEDIIRHNKKRNKNMPTRREDALMQMTMHMLQNESYFYNIQASDDYEAFFELEQSGIVIQTDDARKYYHSHDVFEELVVNHIFQKRYDEQLSGSAFFSPFRPSLRIRKLFRGWLCDFASKMEYQDIIFRILDDENVNKVWKNEVLLAVISTEPLKGAYYKIASDMEKNNGENLRKIIFLIHTCCNVANHTDYTQLALNQGNLLPFRLSKPTGYAWEELFTFIVEHKEALNWDKELIAIVINVLDSWTKHYENAKTVTTRLAGEIGLFLFERIASDRDLKYAIRKEQIEKLQDVLCNSAWMITDSLATVFQTVIDGRIEETPKDPFATGGFRIEAPDMYIDLAKRAVADVYQYGNIPIAMPQITIQLMYALWVRPKGAVIFHSVDLNGYFGLNDHVSHDYYPASAYKTPITKMLSVCQDEITDFLIDFCNRAGDVYVDSHLNSDYKECFPIVIHVGDEEIEQIASERLWMMHRGTHVGPDLLISLLMGFEQWLLNVVEHSKTDIVVAYCRSVLKRSKNVMLTAVFVSIAEAYPDKMMDVVCDLLKTKEIFHLDTQRFGAEHTASFLMFGDSLFEKERRKSNQLPHRRKRLEEIILAYQTQRDNVSEEDFRVRSQKLYHALDEATVDIEKWSTSDKYPYYRMDLRHYKEVVEVQSDEAGHEIYTVMPDFSNDMKELSEQSQSAYQSNMRYVDLQLWSSYKFEGNGDYKKYDKYLDISVVCKELSELWEILCVDNDTATDNQEDCSLFMHRYLATVSYTSAVLLRDYRDVLRDEDLELCEWILLELGKLFTQMDIVGMMQVGNGLEAVTIGLVLLLDEENSRIRSHDNPLYLLLKLVLRDYSDKSRVIKMIADTIWKHHYSSGWRLVYAFTLLADLYEQEVMQNRSLTVEAFLEQHDEEIQQALEKEVVDVTTIEFDKLSLEVVFTVLAFVSPEQKEAAFLAEITKDTAMEITFTDRRNMRDERRELLGHTLNYVVWFADVLLYCDDENRKILIKSFLERADFVGNDNIEDFIRFLIREQERTNHVDTFWKVWELLKPAMLELGKTQERYYYSDYSGPIGIDRIITVYLFANSAWRSNVHRCDLLTDAQIPFFDDFIEQSGSVKAMFYALAKLLNTVGKEAYKECGINWIYKLVLKDMDCSITLYDHTLYYLEEYMGNLVACHRADFRMNERLFMKTQAVLEYMLGQGSQIAFFLGEQI